jgi:hypothetical protein
MIGDLKMEEIMEMIMGIIPAIVMIGLIGALMRSMTKF